jgi:hypothetical protein
VGDPPTLDAFAGAVGERFVVGDPARGVRVSLELVHAATRGSSAFALEFRGPGEPLLEQATYRFDRADGDPIEIFIVPIHRDESGTIYEAIFG